jgi:glycosyltransferase involved in cell wall biosynthesis
MPRPLPFLRPPVDPLRLTIFFPCWNESAHVGPMVKAALHAGSAVVADPARDLEVLIVDDGSTDQTPALAAELAAAHPNVRHIRRPTNGGYGLALRTGFLAASMPWVFYTDGDCQFDLAELPRLIDIVQNEPAIHIVSGYRAPRRDPLPRVLAGRAWTLLANALFDLSLRDIDGAFKLYPRALFDHIVMRSTGALIDAEVLARASALGCTIAQCPVTHLPRRHGNATGLAPRTVARGLHELVALSADIMAGPAGKPAGDPVRAKAL